MITEIEGLSKHSGEVKAVNGVSFGVEEGEIFELLGPNVAGKTTLVEMLCALRRFDHGKVRSALNVGEGYEMHVQGLFHNV